MAEREANGAPVDPRWALRRAGRLLLIALPVVLVFGAFLWGFEGIELALGLPFAWAIVAGPVLAAIAHTYARLSRQAPTAFEPIVLARSGHYAAAALMGFFALGYLGLLVGLPLLLATGATFALAWVRPEGTDALLARLIGAALPLLLFFAAVCIDEKPVVSGVLVAMALSALLRLGLMRRRRQA